MNALMSPMKESFAEVLAEREDFDALWSDEEFCNELVEAISENFALEVEASLMFAQLERTDG